MLDVKVRVNTAPLAKLRRDVASINAMPPHPAFVDMKTQWLRKVSAYTSRRFANFSKGGGDWPALALSTVRSRTKVEGSTESLVDKRWNIVSQGGRDYRQSSDGRLQLIAQARARNTRRGGGVVVTNRRAAILNDTGTLWRSLSIDAPGNIADQIAGGVRYGIGGADKAKLRRNLTTQKVSKKTGKRGKVRTVAGEVTAKVTIAQIAMFHHNGMGHNPVRRIIVKPDEATMRSMSNDLAAAVRKINAEASRAR